MHKLDKHGMQFKSDYRYTRRTIIGIRERIKSLKREGDINLIKGE